jgi:putative transposase
VLGFLDESSPQTIANTVRMWSFRKPIMCKNTTKLKANSFGFYALNGNSAIDFKENSKTGAVCEFLGEIRSKNPDKKIVIILDNFRSHRAVATMEFARNVAIELIYLPPYSPHLNPIEYIWKSIKRVISQTFIRDVEHLRSIIHEKFKEYSSRTGFAKKWIENFLREENKSQMLCF